MIAVCLLLDTLGEITNYKQFMHSLEWFAHCCLEQPFSSFPSEESPLMTNPMACIAKMGWNPNKDMGLILRHGDQQ